MRMIQRGVLFALSLFLAAGLRAEEALTVHEWGTFTSFQDEAGIAIGGINTDDEPVPDFVHDLSKWLLLRPTEVPPSFFQGAPGCHPDVTIRLETPVIYFHPSQQADLSPLDVHVRFRGGWLTQFYPDAKAEAPGIPSPDQRGEFGPILGSTLGKLSWKIQKMGVHETGPETDEHVWTAPRAVKAASIQTEKGEVEKFLFYRGVGRIDAPLRVSRDKDGKNFNIKPQIPSSLKIDKPGDIRRLWLADVRNDGTAAFRKLPALFFGDGQTPLESGGRRPNFTLTTPAIFDPKEFSPENLKRLRASIREALMEDGPFADEADALLNTWELSYFKSPGLRLFFIVPKVWTDYYLPLEISTPAKVERVMVGRIELVTPEQRALLQKIAARSVADVKADHQQLRDICYGGWTAGSGTRERVWSGRAPLSSLGAKLPETYRTYLSLGRFRNALVLHEQQRHPTEGLRQFIQSHGLHGYPPSLVNAASQGNLLLVKELIAERADVNAKDRDGNTALISATFWYREPVDIIRALIAAGANVNAPNDEGKTALMNAAGRGSREVVQALIKAGAEVNGSDNQGESALMHALCGNLSLGHPEVADLLKQAGAKTTDQTALVEAVVREDIVLLESLMAKGANVNMQIPRGVTLLWLAASMGNTESTKSLMAKGADVNYQATGGRTCLMVGIRSGKLGIVKMLMAKGADINAVTQYGDTALTALSVAAGEGNIEMVKTLIEAGANVSAIETPLWEAAASGHAEIVKLLHEKGVDKTTVGNLLGRLVRNGQIAGVRAFLEAGADPNTKVQNLGSGGWDTLLTLASSASHAEIVKLLIEKGADVNERTNEGGGTPLMRGASSGNLGIVRMLLEKGADLHARAGEYTALRYAAFGGHADILKLLVEKGGDLGEKTNGRTLLMGAAREGQVDAVRFLIEKGLDVNAKDNNGTTALMNASSFIGDADIVKLLIEKGAEVNARNNKGQTALGIALHDAHTKKEKKAEIVKLLRKHGATE